VSDRAVRLRPTLPLADTALRALLAGMVADGGAQEEKGGIPQQVQAGNELYEVRTEMELRAARRLTFLIRASKTMRSVALIAAVALMTAGG